MLLRPSYLHVPATASCGVVVALALTLASLAAPPAQAQGGVRTKIVAFGDSLTIGISDNGDDDCDEPNVGYPARLASRLNARGFANEMVNEGECGEETLDGLSRMDDVLDDHADADVVIIMEGTNDLSRTSISVESMRFNIEAMANKVLEAEMRPVIASPPPRDPELWGSNDRGAFLTEKLAEDAELHGIEFANQFDRFDAIPEVYDEHYDSDGLHLDSSGYAYLADGFLGPTIDAIEHLEPVPCVAGPEAICLTNDLFQVEVSWRTRTGETGKGKVGSLSSDTGYFWFFNQENVELVIKILDGRALNDRYWVFYGALSDVEYTISIVDSRTGKKHIYVNPQGNLASVADTDAFPGTLPGDP
jgi:lysophospholipase L1-like esterase